MATTEFFSYMPEIPFVQIEFAVLYLSSCSIGVSPVNARASAILPSATLRSRTSRQRRDGSPIERGEQRIHGSPAFGVRD